MAVVKKNKLIVNTIKMFRAVPWHPSGSQSTPSDNEVQPRVPSQWTLPTAAENRVHPCLPSTINLKYSMMLALNA